MTKRKDYVAMVEMETVNALLELSADLCIDVDIFEGCLVDNLVFYDTTNIKLGRVKPRKYIIIKEVYLNEWSSGIELTMTDNDDKVNEFVSAMESEKNVA